MTTTATDAAIRRAAQAAVDAAYEERVKLEINDDGAIVALTIRRCRLCNLENSTHSVLHECPIEALERLLRSLNAQ